MPNWCYTDYYFYTDSEKGKEQLIELYQTIEKSISNKKRLLNSDFGDTWLGNVIREFCPQNLRLTEDSVFCIFNQEHINFRGSITYLAEPDEYEETAFRLQTETAWAPMNEMWDMILQACGFDEIKYVYEAEEPGNGVYINSDIEGRFFADRYCIDVYVSDDFYCNEMQYFSDEEDALNYLNDVIADLRAEYKAHPEKYKLPEGYSTKGLRKQRSLDKAYEVLQDNLFSDEEYNSDKPNSYIVLNEFTEE